MMEFVLGCIIPRESVTIGVKTTPMILLCNIYKARQSVALFPEVEKCRILSKIPNGLPLTDVYA